MNAPRRPHLSDSQLRDALGRRPDRAGMADDLTRLFAAVEGTAQRRPLAVRLTGRWPKTAVSFVVVLLTLLVLGLALGLVVGSLHRVPPPFGLARPGVIAFDVPSGIVVSRRDGSGRTQLTSGRSDYEPVFSPDGTRIAYATEADDMTVGVVVMDEDGQHATVLGVGFGGVGPISWSPDSDHVAVAARPVGGAPTGDDWHIYVGSATAPGLQPIGGPDLFGFDPAWSVDGRSIAFIRHDPCCGGPQDTLSLIEPDGRNLRSLVAIRSASSPAWSPDGSRLAIEANGVNAASDIYVIGADGSHLRDITNSPEEDGSFAWSPDGTTIAFTRTWTQYGNRASLMIVTPDGSRVITPPGPYVNANTPVWSPDGTCVLGFAFAVPKAVGANDSPASDITLAFDPLGRSQPTLVPISGFVTASWQRRAP